MDIRHISEEYTEIGMRLLEERPELAEIRNAQVSVVFLASEHIKKKSGTLVYGQCEKIPEKYKWGIPCDFTVTLFEPNIAFLNAKQIEILIFHELLHIGVDEDSFFIRPHDLEDFKVIIDKYGVNWSEIAPGMGSDA